MTLKKTRTSSPIAEAYGCAYAGSPRGLKPIFPAAIKAALAANRPTLIEMTPRMLKG